MLTKIKDSITYIVLICVIGFLGYTIYSLKQANKAQMEAIEAHNDICTLNEMSFYDQTISDLKAQNAELYDSLKFYKKELEYVAHFKYTKVYHTDTVYIEKEVPICQEEKEEVKTFEYTNEPTDSLNYKLTIGSKTEPNWYKLDLSVSEQFTLVNRRNEYNMNTTTIQPSTNGEITDVTVWKKDQTTFWDNFSVGPTVTAGYDIVNDKLGVVVGVGATWRINPKKH
jgi:hypothetical protein